MDLQARFQMQEFVATEYADFVDFATAGMLFLGYPITDIQADIAEYMQSGPRLRMVMAQRGEAKSTLAALYAVWRLVQDPREIVLIVSGGETQASEVANLVIRLILVWDLLEFLRPDTRSGDRNSYQAFDVHWALKGVNKSPSVACVGITANIQGKRASLLLADDVETTKNGLTVTQRQQLAALTREFSSICANGDILYLGTPQTKDSVYNGLPQRGFEIRIWPGRYPTHEEEERYGAHLAPIVRSRMLSNPALRTSGGVDGTRGRPVDPRRFNEDALREKELDQGPEGFQLQYMLDTTLSDALRLQLKLSDLVIANFDPDRLPEFLVYQSSPQYLVELPDGFTERTAKLYHPMIPQGVQFFTRGKAIMFIDPAGGGGDEIGYGVSVAQGAYIHVLDVGGLLGGLTEENGGKLCDIIKELNVGHVQVESNMGHGLFETSLRGMLAARKMTDVGVASEYSSGQKERRIIDSLVGAMQRHRLVVHKRVLQSDVLWNKQHTPEKRAERSLWYQLANITTDRGSLPKDDRIEALAGCVRWHKAALEKNAEAEAQARADAEAREAMRNPMGYVDPAWQAAHNRKSTGTRKLIDKRRWRWSTGT